MVSNLNYIKQLDGLRAISVVSVMIGHWLVWESNSVFIKNFPWHHGVILFFVLSGYLITLILLNQKEKIETANKSKRLSIFSELKLFYYRRIFRIFPAYYVLLAILFFLNFPDVKIYFPWLVTYCSNFLLIEKGNYIGEFSHLWSLAIEEQFYLFWPFILLFFAKRKLLRMMLICLLVSFISRAICTVLYSQNVVNWMWGAYFTINLIFPLALGAILAFLKTEKRHANFYFKLSKFHLLYASLIAYSLFYYIFVFKMNLMIYKVLFDEFLFAIVCFFIILRANQNGFTHIAKYILEHDLTVFTGKISYGLYLYHMFAAAFFWKFLSSQFQITIGNKYMIYLVYFIITYLFALTSYYFLEQPLNKLKNKLFNY